MKFKNNKTVKMKKLNYYIPFIIISLLMILNTSGCKEEPPIVPPPPPPPEQKDSIVVSVEDVTHRSISLCMQLTVSNRQSKNIKLFREFNSNEYLIAEYPVTVTDTTIIDDDNGAGLLLDTTYSYYAVIIDSTGNVKDTSNTVTARTLAPTTHNYTWTEYTIGEWQSALFDVWGTDENNVWAIGGMTINGNFYGALHYNGTEWIPDSTVGGATIFGFSETDIWVAGGGVFNFDGNNWIQKDKKIVNGSVITLDSVLKENTPYTSIWGTSSSNMYFGSTWGKIIHWDGQKAEVVKEFPTITVTDILGLNNNFILASISNSIPPGEVHLYNGIEWQRLQGLNDNNLYESIYAVSPKEFYTAGEEILLNRDGEWSEPVNADVYIECIRGNRQTGDIVAAGHSSTLFHYNGIDWQKFQFQLTQYTPLLGLYITKNKIFAVGSFGNQARIIIGSRN